MSVLFIITLALLAAIAYTIYRRQQSYTHDARELEPVRGRSLFVEEGWSAQPPALHAQTETGGEAERAALLARAAAGDESTLAEARRLNDPGLYRTVINLLVKACASSTEKLETLAASVSADDASRARVELAEAYRRVWERSPDAPSTARALHLAALADDAVSFGAVVEAAARLRREGLLQTLGAAELNALVESEYWVLSAEARASGQGFVLKQMIAALRAESSGRGEVDRKPT